MPLTKAKKAEKVTQLAHELEGSTSAIIGTFAKLTVAQDFELRRTVRAAGGRYRVLKNKLAARAAQGSKIEAALQGLKGVSSVAYTSGDPVALAKALSTWVGDNAEFTFKLGIIDGKVISVEEVKQLATMPGKEELFAKLLFLINSPAQRLATVINATGRDLAVVINQAVEKNKFAGAQAPAAAEPTPVAEQAQAAETPAAVAEPVAAAEPAAPEVPAVEQAQVAETSAVVAEPAAAAEPAAPEVSGGEAEAPAAE